MTEPLALAAAVGMAATVNPCGFALLPAYLVALVGLDDSNGRSRVRSLCPRLVRCRDEDGVDPYHWLAAASPGGEMALDLACGSGPTRRLVEGTWVGIDRSPVSCAEPPRTGPDPCSEATRSNSP